MLSGQAGRMAQLVKALAAEPDDLSLCWKEQPNAFSYTALLIRSLEGSPQRFLPKEDIPCHQGYTT